MLRWCLDTQNALFLRRLIPADIDKVAEFSSRAFNSPAIAEKIQTMLGIYCTSGVDRLRLEQQVTLLPVVYYILTINRPSGETRIGLTGLYTPLWAGEGVYWLGWFAIDPAFQGRGYGTRLLQASLSLAAARGGRKLCVETSGNLDAALSLYERQGFARSGEVCDYWAPGLHLLILRRSLADIPIPQEIPDDL